jgi:halimadienyl-diphosphate synthase
VARVPDLKHPRRPAFPRALDWLLQHQQADGSWGVRLKYHHDRVLSTLAAMLTLSYWQEQFETDTWSSRLEAARQSIWNHVQGLHRDPYDLIGFELIVPTLLEDARRQGLTLPYASFGEVVRTCEAKLKLIPPELIYTRNVSTIFSAEFLGDRLDVSRVNGLQDDNGSIASSPSATAYYLLKDPRNRAARDYLARVLDGHDGAAPAVDPIDVFEAAWVLFSAAQVWPDASQLAFEIGPHVDVLIEEFRRKNGAGYNSYFAVPDLDGTSMVFRVLNWVGIDPDPALLAQFEEDDHFRCFPFERNPSISAHVHLLDALRAAPEFPRRRRMIGKVLDFLGRSRTLQTFWFDKWHASPYYTTAHAIIALREHRYLAEEAAYWMINTQNKDGSWGYYDEGTAEETAYCLQALVSYQRGGAACEQIASAIRRGAEYLASSIERRACAYTPLWIGKSLYTPTWVVHAAVLSALALAEAG